MDGWEVDVNKAYEISKKTGKPILANFTGSDWCGWCIKLKNEVFIKDEFKTWAKDNVVLLELDFPRRFQLPEEIKQQNYGLQQA
ncbi:MAG: thioredoxin, partial [Flavobacteriales bacterium CG18_big_fil_WC_8_21_14_2_50_32_9]